MTRQPPMINEGVTHIASRSVILQATVDRIGTPLPKYSRQVGPHVVTLKEGMWVLFGLFGVLSSPTSTG